MIYEQPHSISCMADTSILAPWTTLALEAVTGHLLLITLAALTAYILILALSIHPTVHGVFTVSPSVVLLDNHTTNRKTGKFMAGSGRINLMKTGKVILLTI